MKISSPDPRNGFTLIEILVVLALLGIGYALSAPSFFQTRRQTDGGAQRVVDAARRIAVQRGGVVIVSFEPGGDWRIESGSEAGSRELCTGSIVWPHALTERLQISPLGSCMLEYANGREPAFTIDLVGCRLRAQ